MRRGRLRPTTKKLVVIREPRHVASANLHRALVHEESVECGRSFVGDARLVEDDRGDATADAIRSIGDGGPLNGTHGFAKVFLMKSGEHES